MLLVQSTTSGRWTVPSGGLEYNMTAEDNAQKETYEEAGVIGELTHDLGSFSFKKSTGVKQTCKLFGLLVTRELKKYPESKMRKRKWHTIAAAEIAVNRGSKQIKRLKKDLKKQMELEIAPVNSVIKLKKKGDKPKKDKRRKRNELCSCKLS